MQWLAMCILISVLAAEVSTIKFTAAESWWTFGIHAAFKLSSLQNFTLSFIFLNLLHVTFFLIGLEIQVEQSTSKFTSIELCFNFLNKLQYDLNPFKIVNLVQIEDKILQPHILITIGQYFIFYFGSFLSVEYLRLGNITVAHILDRLFHRETACRLLIHHQQLLRCIGIVYAAFTICGLHEFVLLCTEIVNLPFLHRFQHFLLLLLGTLC